ncbi:hypothetical protein TNCV_5129221 [Trichonephila clavipes]|nr:hypothetical protein TNCV_5129221 [Trichonephila clavipes]
MQMGLHDDEVKNMCITLVDSMPMRVEEENVAKHLGMRTESPMGIGACAEESKCSNKERRLIAEAVRVRT